jgi:hypothetical protein
MYKTVHILAQTTNPCILTILTNKQRLKTWYSPFVYGTFMFWCGITDSCGNCAVVVGPATSSPGSRQPCYDGAKQLVWLSLQWFQTEVCSI